MRCQVLGLINNEILPRHRPAANVGQRLHLKDALVQKRLIRRLPAAAPVVSVVLPKEKVEVVENGLHPRIELLAHIPRKKTHVAPERKIGRLTTSRLNSRSSATFLRPQAIAIKVFPVPAMPSMVTR